MSEKKGNKNTALQIAKKTQNDVLSEIRKFQDRGELSLPANYSPENAMKSAWLIIQETLDRNKKPALEVCTQNSFANALLSMVVQGLNPEKKQCYFIVYGNKLVCQRSYFGTMAVAKRVNPDVLDFQAQPIYEGDDVELEIRNGKTYVATHKTKFGNIDKKNIIGAYCTIVRADDDNYSEIMTIDEIKDAWRKSQMNPVDEKGNVKANSTHGQFAQEMARKTVSSRAAKRIINTSDDSSLLVNIARQNDVDIAQAEADAEIEEKANKGDVIDAEYMEVQEPEALPEAPPPIDHETGELLDDAPETGPGF